MLKKLKYYFNALVAFILGIATVPSLLIAIIVVYAAYSMFKPLIFVVCVAGMAFVYYNIKRKQNGR